MFKLNAYLLRKKFKITILWDHLLFTVIIVGVLAVIPLVNYGIDHYNELLSLKLVFILLSLKNSIFPSSNVSGKRQVTVFFSTIDKEKLNQIYLYKNYVISMLFAAYFLMPFSAVQMPLFLLSMSVLVFFFFGIIVLRKALSKNIFKVASKIIEMTLSIGFLVALDQIKSIDLLAIAHGYSTPSYFMVIGLLMTLSIWLLRAIGSDDFAETHGCNRLLIGITDNGWIDYNLRYLIRKSLLPFVVATFYMNLVFLKGQPENVIIVVLSLYSVA